MYVDREPKKTCHQAFVRIPLPNINRFWQLFYWHFTTPKTRRYTTLWNIFFFKLHEPKHSNGKLTADELKKMWWW